MRSVLTRTIVMILGVVLLSAAGNARAASTPAAARRTAPGLVLSIVPPAGAGRLTVLRWTGTRYEPAAVRTASQGGASLVVPGGCVKDAVFVVETGSRVSRPVRPDTGRCSSPIAVKLLPRANVTFDAVAASGGRVPRTAVLRFAPCPAPGSVNAPAAARLPVALSPAGAVKAVIPAGCTDLSLLTAAFAPHSWWGLDLPAGKVTRLGTVRLRSGASLLVHTADADDGLPLAGVTVSLVSAAHAARAIHAALGGHAPKGGVASGTSGTRGWVRLSGLPGGRFLLIAVAKHHTPGCAKVALERGKETVVDAIEVGRPGSLDVFVDDADLNLPPGFALELVPHVRICCRDVVALAPVAVPPSGAVHLSRLVPGRWKLELALMQPSGPYSTMGSGEVTIPSGGGASLEVSLEGKLFHGEVLLGGEPVEAHLEFAAVKPRPGDSSVSSASRADGSFTVLLPRPGAYNVRVSVAQPAFTTTAPGVQFEKPSKAVKVRLPDGRIEGSVTGERGNAVAGAEIVGYELSGGRGRPRAGLPPTANAVSADDGSFTIEGLVPGRWTLSATRGDLTSGPRSVGVTSGGEGAEVTLVLRATFLLKGAVRLPGGAPVANASVHALVRGSSGMPEVASARTDATGRFELRLHAHEGDPVNVTVAGPGIGAAAFPVHLAHAPLRLGVTRLSGRVAFSLPLDRQVSFHVALVRPDGAFITLEDLVAAGLAWKQGKDHAEISIARLAPGRWNVVDISHPAAGLALVSGAGAGLPAIARFTLVAGTTQRVTIGG
ncbi:MAG: carboxypeptidase regulatory-like domain-containing protein [Acidobacteria bacterium]|nr:carboxypeptidase regulatory-like domain-containing protein [Acidobacteriota bacterium]